MQMTRRALLGSATEAACLAATALPTLATPNPDAEIHRLFRLWCDNERRYLSEFSDEASEDIVNVSAGLGHRISAIAPQTIEGFAIKVYLMMKENDETPYGKPFEVVMPAEEDATRFIDAALEVGVYRDVMRMVRIG